MNDFFKLVLVVTVLFFAQFIGATTSKKLKNEDRRSFEDARAVSLRLPNLIPKVEPFLKARCNAPYSVSNRKYFPVVNDKPYREKGLASWYGRRFQGRLTASGERYDMYKISGAHRILPIPSYVRVTNLENNRSLVVRINDRGPFVKGRIIDLSFSAAVKLGFERQGLARVRVERITTYQIKKGKSSSF